MMPPWRDDSSNGDGRRARLGIVVPSVNTVMEPWAQKVVPDGVSVFASRMFIPPAMTPDAFIEMDRNEGKAAIRQLSSVFPDAIAYGCTASSIVQGLAYDAHLRAEIERDVQDAVDHGRTRDPDGREGARRRDRQHRLALHQGGRRGRAPLLRRAGLTVVGGACLGIADGFALAEPEPDALFELGLRGFDARADGLIMTCLNTRSHTVIDRLEQALGKPVITSTQATLWHALRLAGIDDRIAGYGTLLERH